MGACWFYLGSKTRRILEGQFPFSFFSPTCDLLRNLAFHESRGRSNTCGVFCLDLLNHMKNISRSHAMYNTICTPVNFPLVTSYIWSDVDLHFMPVLIWDQRYMMDVHVQRSGFD